MTFPSEVKEFADIVFNAGYEIYLVGGAVRNLKRGLPPDDYDFTTNATPQQITALFRKVIPTGIEHGTVTVLYKGNSFEVTLIRCEHPHQLRRKYNDNDAEGNGDHFRKTQ